MKLTRPIILIDCEVTGLDPVTDRLIELAMLAFDGDKIISNSSCRFNPGIPIPPEATAIHGITDADVADCIAFDAAMGRRILARLNGCDIGGYNVRRLDLPLLDEELRRVGLKLDLAGVHVLDAFGIFSKKEPRKLEDAVRRYCGREHVGAHGAKADNEATLDVLLGELKAYPDLDAMPLAELAVYSTMGDYAPVDIAGKLGRDKDGDCVYLFGKSRGVKVRDDPGFGRWMLQRDFPGSTLEALNAEFDRIYGEEEFAEAANDE
jgi:DNA polymerase-3 subunit epsilon